MLNDNCGALLETPKDCKSRLDAINKRIDGFPGITGGYANRSDQIPVVLAAELAGFLEDVADGKILLKRIYP